MLVRHKPPMTKTRVAHLRLKLTAGLGGNRAAGERPRAEVYQCDMANDDYEFVELCMDDSQWRLYVSLWCRKCIAVI